MRMNKDIEEALNDIGRIAAGIEGKGKTQDGALVYVITAEANAPDKFPHLMLKTAVRTIRSYINELEEQNKEDPAITRLKCINELRGCLSNLKSVSADSIEFYDKRTL